MPSSPYDASPANSIRSLENRLNLRTLLMGRVVPAAVSFPRVAGNGSGPVGLLERMLAALFPHHRDELRSLPTRTLSRAEGSAQLHSLPTAYASATFTMTQVPIARTHDSHFVRD